MANDTLIPEMQNQDIERMYTRGASRSNGVVNGTYVPEMHVDAQGLVNDSTPFANSSREEAVIGFLYSVSRRGIGEYWPLHLGSNTIGRADNCNIQLKEQTVSDRHAVINIKKMKSSGELIASIRDDGSKNGIYLNSEELDYDNHPCKNGDVITIGTNYQLLLILINASQYGLKVAEGFQPVVEQTMPVSNLDPFGEETMYHQKRQHIDDGTIDLGGASPYMGGGTRVL